MQRIANGTQLDALPKPDSTTGTPGFFGRTTDGAPGPTRVSRDWLNGVQEELVAIILGLGGTLSSTSLNQIWTGLVATFAKLASPAFTGNPTAPTQLSSDSSTRLATTAYATAKASAAQTAAQSFATSADTAVLAAADAYALSLVPASFLSAAQTLITSGVVSLAHGLGAYPGTWGAFIQCISADAGYSVGERITLPIDWYDGHAGGSNTAMSAVRANPTNVSYSCLIASGQYVVVNAGGTADVGLTTANWQLYLWAKA